MTPSMTENKENQQSKGFKLKQRVAERLRSLNLSLKLTKPNQSDIILEAPVIDVPVKVEVDKHQKWLSDKIPLKNLPIAPSKSPKTPRKALNKKLGLKHELEAKMKIRRKEEQEERFMVYNADNEIDEDVEEEEEITTDEENENVEEKKKPKITVNEDEEIIEIKSDASDSDVEADDEDEIASDEDSVIAYDDEEDGRTKNPMVDDEASEDSEDEKTPARHSRVKISDDEYDCSLEPSFEIPTIPKSTDLKTSSELPPPPPPTVDASQGFFATGLTQLLEPFIGQTAPVEPDPSQRSLALDTQAEKDELMMLCSGSFGAPPPSTQESDQTMCSKFEKYNVMDYLSDTSPLDTQELKDKSFGDKNIDEEKKANQQRLDAIYKEFYDAEDSIVDVQFSDSDSELPRKRKIVVYSDDENIQETKPKAPKIFDSDDSEDETASNISFPKKAVQNVPLDDDIFTTEDPSNKSGALDGFESEADDDEVSEGVKSDNESNIADDILSEVGSVCKFVDDQASLSGSDVGDDPDDEDDLDGGYNDYEVDEADKEDIDQEEVRNGLVKHYLKQLNDDDEKRLYRLQEKFLADGDLHGVGNMDRSFRARMGKDISDEEWQKLVKLNHISVVNDASDDDEEEIFSAKKNSTELKKHLLNNKKGNDDEADDLLDDDSPLLAAGRQALNKSSAKINPKTNEMTSRDSLLRNSNSLAILMKENTESRTTATLFTAVKDTS